MSKRSSKSRQKKEQSPVIARATSTFNYTKNGQERPVPKGGEKKLEDQIELSKAQQSTDSSNSDEGGISARSSRPIYAAYSPVEDTEADVSDALILQMLGFKKSSPELVPLKEDDGVKISGCLNERATARESSESAADDGDVYGGQGIATTTAKRTRSEDYYDSECEETERSKSNREFCNDKHGRQNGSTGALEGTGFLSQNENPQQFSRHRSKNGIHFLSKQNQHRGSRYITKNNNDSMSDEIPESDDNDRGERQNVAFNDDAAQMSGSDSAASSFGAAAGSEDDKTATSTHTSRKRKRNSTPQEASLQKAKKPRNNQGTKFPEKNPKHRRRDVGQFRDDEIEALENFKQNFCEEYGVSEGQFNDCMNLTKGTRWPNGLEFTKKVMFREFFQVLPLRDNKSMLRYKDRKWRNRLEEPNSWTAEQDDELFQMVSTRGKKWAAIAQDLGRSYDEVHQRWKNKLQNRDQMRQGDWSAREVDTLRAAVNEALEKLGPEAGTEDVSWEGISRAMSYGRSAQQCSNKWRKLTAEDAKYRWLEEAKLRVPEGYQLQLIRTRTASDDGPASTPTSSRKQRSTSARKLVPSRQSTSTPSPMEQPGSNEPTERQISRVPKSIPANETSPPLDTITASASSVSVEKLPEKRMPPPPFLPRTRSKDQRLPLSQASAATSPLMRPIQSQQIERPSPQIPIRQMPDRTTGEDELSQRSKSAQSDEELSSSSSENHDASSSSEDDSDDDQGGNNSKALRHVSESETSGISEDDEESRNGYESMEIDAHPGAQESSSDSEPQISALASPRSRLRDRERASRSSSRRK